jgi:anaerobic ribonucleoside-triphosphate reductase
MNRKESIDAELARLHEEMADIHGTPCEVMQRICGYYRNTKHWNNGKASEYKDRKEYSTPSCDKSESMIQLHLG